MFSLLLTLVAIVGLGVSNGWRVAIPWIWMPIVLLLLIFFGARQGIKASQGQIYETESQYNYIQVLEENGYRYLRLNDGQGIHSVYHPTEVIYYGPWMQFLSAPFFNEAPFPLEELNSMAIVGLAAGTTVHQATEVFGPIPIDGFEIDPKIIEIGQEYFDMNQPNLNAIAQDGRWGLEHSNKKYDLIALDAYRPPYIPWHLTTVEYFQIVKDHMTENGAAAINVGRAPDDRRLIDVIVSTLQRVFPSVYIIDVPESFNSIIFATMKPTSVDNLYFNMFEILDQQDVHPLLKEALQITALNLQPTPTAIMVFTDDLAPVEWITNNMVLRYMLLGDLEVIR